MDYTTHYFDTIEDALTAVRAAARVDHTLCPDAPNFNPGDVLVVNQEVYYVTATGSISKLDEANKIVSWRMVRPGELSYGAAEVLAKISVKKKRDRHNAILAAVAAAVGPRAQVKPSADLDAARSSADDTLFIDGNMVYELKISPDYSRSGWNRYSTGKWSVTVGEYRSKTRFPERRDGTHNYQKVAELLLAIADRRLQDKEVMDREEQNRQVVTDEVAATLGPLSSCIRPSADPERPVRISFNLDRCLTVEQARQLAAALESIGITGRLY